MAQCTNGCFLGSVEQCMVGVERPALCAECTMQCGFAGAYTCFSWRCPKRAYVGAGRVLFSLFIAHHIGELLVLRKVYLAAC